MKWVSTRSKPQLAPSRQREGRLIGAALSLALCLLLGGWVQAQEGEVVPKPPDFPPAPPPKATYAPAVPTASTRPWSTEVKSGWNLLAFPGQVEGPVSGLSYALLDASTGQPLTGAPTPWKAYWAYAEEASTLHAPVAPATAPSHLPLQAGWNALASPLLEAAQIQEIRPLGGGGPALYSQCYSGELGKFQAMPVRPGSSLPPGQVVWVYAYQPCQIWLQPPTASAATSVAPPGGASRWTVYGQLYDDRGAGLPQAKVSLRSDYGRQSTVTDGGGRFSATVAGVPTEARQASVRVRIAAPYFDAWKSTLSLPLTQPVRVHLTRKTATLSISAYPYKWGAREFQPVTVLIYEQGNYHKRFTRWFPRAYGGRTDATVEYFPQGRPYRMVVTWADHRGNQQTLTRDGTVTSAYQSFILYNSWTYN